MGADFTVTTALSPPDVTGSSGEADDGGPDKGVSGLDGPVLPPAEMAEIAGRLRV